MISISIYFAFLIVLTAAIIWTPSLAIVAAFLIFPLDQWVEITSRVYVPDRTFTNYAVAGILLLALLLDLNKRFTMKTGKSHVGIIFCLLVLLFFYAYLSTYWIPTPYRWVPEHFRPHELWMRHMPYMALFAFTAPFLVRDQRDLTRIAKVLIILSVPLVLLLMLNLELIGRRYLIDGQLEKFNPLALARFGGVLIIASACMYGEGKKWNIICIFGIIIGFGLIFKTETRGQFVSAVYCASLVFLFSFGNISKFSLVSKSLLSVGILVAIYSMVSIDSVANLIELQFDARVATDESTRWSLEQGTLAFQFRWDNAMRLASAWLSSPVSIIFGLGNTASYGVIGFYVHIVPLEVLFEQGLLGLGIYLTILFYVLRKSIQIIRFSKQSGSHSHVLWIFPFLALFEFIVTLKEGSLIANWYFVMVVILVERVASISSSELAQKQGQCQPEISPFDGRVGKGGTIKNSTT